jgi:hypothetical protein
LPFALGLSPILVDFDFDVYSAPIVRLHKKIERSSIGLSRAPSWEAEQLIG